MDFWKIIIHFEQYKQFNFIFKLFKNKFSSKLKERFANFGKILINMSNEVSKIRIFK